MAADAPAGRRPLRTRDWPFFQKLAAGLARRGVSPNAISFWSIVFGIASGAAFVATSFCEGWTQRGCWLLAAGFIQLRLIANLLDGMVAVEGGKGGPTGDLWNEAPDRVSDAAILIGAGYAAGSIPALGWGAALIAVFVAYVRALGASVGAGQVFLGPMAKPHRMAALTLAGAIRAVLPPPVHVLPPPDSGFSLDSPTANLFLHDTYYVIVDFGSLVLLLALSIVIVGGLVTAVRRLRRIAAFLRHPPRP